MAFRGRTEAAEALVEGWRDYTERAERVLGPDHRETAWGLSQWGVTVRRADPSASGAAEALPLSTRAVAIAERSYGPDHPQTAAIKSAHASTLSALGRYGDAIAMLENARDIYLTTFGPDHPQVGLKLRDLARAWINAGNDDRGDEVLREGYAQLTRSLGATHPVTLSERVSIGRRMLARGQTTEGLEWIRSLHAALDSLPEPHPQNVADARLALAHALALAEDWAAADSLVRLVRPTLEGLSPETTRFLGEVEAVIRSGTGPPA
jgi:tetratricopeptide (TPR) repeat protein